MAGYDGQIRATPELLKTRSTECGTQAEAIGTVIEQVSRIMENLQGEWEGAASNAYNEQWLETLPHITRVKENLETASHQLREIADATDDLDKRMAGQLGYQ